MSSEHLRLQSVPSAPSILTGCSPLCSSLLDVYKLICSFLLPLFCFSSGMRSSRAVGGFWCVSPLHSWGEERRRRMKLLLSCLSCSRTSGSRRAAGRRPPLAGRGRERESLPSAGRSDRGWTAGPGGPAPRSPACTGNSGGLPRSRRSYLHRNTAR